MSERSDWIAKLTRDIDARNSYIRAKLDVLLPAQIHALRLRGRWKQSTLASEAGMKQSRISAMETPGAVNFNLETLVRVAAAFKVGLIVKFVSLSEMLREENEFCQDTFDVTQIDRDIVFQNPSVAARSLQVVAGPSSTYLTGRTTTNVSAAVVTAGEVIRGEGNTFEAARVPFLALVDTSDR